MTEVKDFNIPPIGSAQIGIDSLQNDKNIKKPDVAIFDNAPNDVSIGSFFGKIFIGLVVGICVAALLFGTLTAIGGLTGSDDGNINSMISILLPIIGFIVGFVGNLALALMYNIFFSKRYYNFSKMFGLIFTSSLILFVFFFIIYLLFKDMHSLYAILGFQIIFELFIAINLIDFLSQPNYSASSLMGNTLGCVLSAIIHLVIISNMSNFNILLIVVSAILAYVMTIFGSGIWDAIYYKFYEWGNNPFYLPSLNELREERQKEENKKEKEDEDVNVEVGE